MSAMPLSIEAATAVVARPSQKRARWSGNARLKRYTVPTATCAATAVGTFALDVSGCCVVPLGWIERAKNTGSARVEKPRLQKYDLKELQEPDDLWGKLFLVWLKSVQEEVDLNNQLLEVLAEAVTNLDMALSDLLPEKPDELRTAIRAIEDARQARQQQSKRVLDWTERLAVIGQQIVASQKST